MTTEEITLLIKTADERIAAIQPTQAELYQRLEALEKEVEELSRPMLAARNAWHEVYFEIRNLENLKALYATELAKTGGIAA